MCFIPTSFSDTQFQLCFWPFWKTSLGDISMCVHTLAESLSLSSVLQSLQSLSSLQPMPSAISRTTGSLNSTPASKDSKLMVLRILFPWVKTKSWLFTTVRAFAGFYPTPHLVTPRQWHASYTAQTRSYPTKQIPMAHINFITLYKCFKTSVFTLRFKFLSLLFYFLMHKSAKSNPNGTALLTHTLVILSYITVLFSNLSIHLVVI